MMSEWKNHVQGPQPEDTIGEKVRVILSRDGHVTTPIPANEVDWDFPSDPVVAYQVVKEE